MAAQEFPLIGDVGTQGIVRIGNTVRRPLRPFSLAIQSYLAYIRQAGFTGAPEPLGIDEEGREILSYVEGDIPREPLPDWTASIDVLTGLAVLIRRLHEAARGWEAPPDTQWGIVPGSVANRGVSAFSDGEPEIFSHRNYVPGRVVFRDGLPAALVNFDLAKPCTKVYDIANAMYWWVPLCDPVDRAPAFAPLEAAERAAVFADAYGMSGEQRAALVPVATAMVRRFQDNMARAARVDAVGRRLWDEGGLKDQLPRAEAWLVREGPCIAARLRA